jgi:hypothetical protein
MPPSRLQLAKAVITKFFDADEKHAFSRRDLSTILSQQRSNWRLAYSTTVNQFIDFLVHNTQLKETKLQSETYSLPARYTWGDASAYLVALSLRKAGYFSHATAMSLHALIKQIPKTIYVNFEQGPKRPSGGLTQESLDRAFANRQRQTNYVFRYGDFQIAILSGKHTGRLGVVSAQGPAGEPVDVTNLERTLIAGGVFQVLEAFCSAKPKMSVNALLAILKGLNYVYPYHQATGFYMQRAGYEESRWQQLRAIERSYDFYLAHDLRDKSYDPDWRLFYPKRFQ